MDDKCNLNLCAERIAEIVLKTVVDSESEGLITCSQLSAIATTDQRLIDEIKSLLTRISASDRLANTSVLAPLEAQLVPGATRFDAITMFRQNETVDGVVLGNFGEGALRLLRFVDLELDVPSTPVRIHNIRRKATFRTMLNHLGSPVENLGLPFATVWWLLKEQRLRTCDAYLTDGLGNIFFVKVSSSQVPYVLYSVWRRGEYFIDACPANQTWLSGNRIFSR